MLQPNWSFITPARRAAIPIHMVYGLFLIVLALALGWPTAIAFACLTAVRRAATGAAGQTVGWAALAVLIASLPWLLWAGASMLRREDAKARRVPEPLRVERTEYALEDDFGGIGMPGDNETGLVLYRLTPESAALVRSSGAAVLKSRTLGLWRPTPIAATPDNAPWRRSVRGAPPSAPHRASTASYLGRYGFSVPVEPARLRELDEVINAAGSSYATGQGGSVTVVDPRRGVLYYIYAG